MIGNLIPRAVGVSAPTHRGFFRLLVPASGGFALPQPSVKQPSVRGVYSSFHSKLKASLPVPAEPSSKAKQTRFLSGGFSCLSCGVGGVYVGPILLFLLLFLPLGLGGARGGSEAGEGFAAVPAQPLGSRLALRDDLQLPLPRQPRPRLWLITGLIDVLDSVFLAPLCAADVVVFGVCSALLDAELSHHPRPSGDSEFGLLILRRSRNHSCHIITAAHCPSLLKIRAPSQAFWDVVPPPG